MEELEDRSQSGRHRRSEVQVIGLEQAIEDADHSQRGFHAVHQSGDEKAL